MPKPLTSQMEGASPLVVYSCYFSVAREGEQFMGDHILSYQVAGQLIMNDGVRDYVFNPGDIRYIKKNSLLKFQKIPPKDGQFRSVSIYLDQEMLRKVCIHKNIRVDPSHKGKPIVPLPHTPLLDSFFKSLLPYENNQASLDNTLIYLKMKEAIMILLETAPELKDSLFDFSVPGKINLEEFMQHHYHFNVRMSRFAYLTGRSLATFKRDFQKTFQTSPSKWLMQKRLTEAHYLILEKGRAPTDVYLELGFENLSHFSYAFKKTYGVAPSRIRTAGLDHKPDMPLPINH